MLFGQTTEALPTSISMSPCETLGSTPLITVVEMAYGFPNYLMDGTAWIRNQCVMLSPTPFGSSRPDVVQSTLQGLLTNQLQLAVHKEFRAIPVYVLKFPTDGTPLKIHQDQSDSNGVILPGQASISVERAPIFRFAEMLSGVIRRPIDNQVTLSGPFTFQLKWGQDGMQKAIKEQLGLELESETQPVEFLVIDRVGVQHAK